MTLTYKQNKLIDIATNTFAEKNDVILDKNIRELIASNEQLAHRGNSCRYKNQNNFFGILFP